MNATLCACPMLCRDYAERAWCALWPCFRGSRAHVADRRRAISVAVKPMDIASFPYFPYFPYTTSCTLCVIHAHTLYALPFRYVSDVPSSPSLPVRSPYVVAYCGASMHPHLHSMCSVSAQYLLTLRLLWLIGRFIPFGPPSYQP